MYEVDMWYKHLSYPYNVMKSVYNLDYVDYHNISEEELIHRLDTAYQLLVQNGHEKKVTAFKLRFKEQRTYKSIAQVLGVTPERVRQVINEIGRRLRRDMYKSCIFRQS